MKNTIRIALIAIICSAGSVMAQSPKPMPTLPTIDRAALEIRANQEFDSGNFSGALPMLKKLAELYKNNPDAIGQIEEKVRVCERNLAAGPSTMPAVDTTPRKPHPTPTPGQTMEMTIKELGNFEYDADKGGKIPADVIALNGQQIRLRGFMIPMDQAANITQFALVADLFSCCFGQPPQLQHTVIVNCPKGKAVGYYPDEITVEGTLKVAEKKDEGFIVSIFEVAVSSVKPSSK